MEDCKVIPVFTHKGGVGKTTTSLCLAASLTRMGAKVLLIDLDPQCNASIAFGIDCWDEDLKHIGLALQKKRKKLTDLIIQTSTGIDLIASHKEDLAETELYLVSVDNRELRLRRAIEEDKLKDHYHYIIIDCAPSIGLLNANAICAADEFLIPAHAEYFSAEGIDAVLKFAQRYQDKNPALDLLGIVITKFNQDQVTTSKSSKLIAQDYRERGDKVFKTTIRLSKDLADFPATHKTIFDYAPNCNGAIDYMNLTKEILDRHGK